VMQIDGRKWLDRQRGAIRTLLGRMFLVLFVNIGMAVMGAIFIVARFHRPKDLDLSGPELTLSSPLPHAGVSRQVPQFGLGS